MPYGPWTEWSECEGNCGLGTGFKVRERRCLKKAPACKKVGGYLAVQDRASCTIPCKGKHR